MRWQGNKVFKEVVTEDGYHLRVEYIHKSKYWWIVSKNRKILFTPISANDYGKSFQFAKIRAMQCMIKHLKLEDS